MIIVFLFSILRQVTEKRTINDPRFHKLEEILEVEEEKPEFVI